MKYIFETRMAVRDYECDIEGIVNNANYLHYAEHTRHLFLHSLGVSFAKFHEQGIDAVVHSMKLQYKVPLRCDDEFISRTRLSRQWPACPQPRIRRGLQGLYLRIFTCLYAAWPKPCLLPLPSPPVHQDLYR